MSENVDHATVHAAQFQPTVHGPITPHRTHDEGAGQAITAPFTATTTRPITFHALSLESVERGSGQTRSPNHQQPTR
jgi:hypothetical protein